MMTFMKLTRDANGRAMLRVYDAGRLTVELAVDSLESMLRNCESTSWRLDPDLQLKPAPGGEGHDWLGPVECCDCRDCRKKRLVGCPRGERLL
jgi:hypothetical protein